MTTRIGWTLLATALAVGGAAAPALAGEPADSTLARAQVLFEAGHFERADAALAKARWSDPRVARMRGRLSLLANRNADAQRWFGRARSKREPDTTLTAWLAESHYRRDQFPQAAKLLRSIGHESKANKLASFGRRKPYRLIAGGDETAIPFVFTDPLPILEARVDDGPTILLVLDTGGGELILDPEFAERLELEHFGNDVGTFASDKQAQVGNARIDRLVLGDFEIADVPVRLVPTARFSAVAQGETIYGILGTVLLYHFLATIDYPGEQLVLRRPGRAAQDWLAAEAAAENSVSVPFWLAGDHLIVAQGMLNESGPHMLFVDTGLAGNGFTGPESIVTEAKLQLFKKQSQQGIGGDGSTVRYVPLIVDKLKLGDALREDLPGVYGVFPESLEFGQGFRIAGLVSHAFFRSYAMTLDFTGMRMILREAEAR